MPEISKKFLWVDDIRKPPDVGFADKIEDSQWLWVGDYEEAKIALSVYEFETISLDFDLGEGKTGLDILIWAHNHGLCPEKVLFHSQNPVGRARMENYYNIDMERNK